MKSIGRLSSNLKDNLSRIYDKYADTRLFRSRERREPKSFLKIFRIRLILLYTLSHLNLGQGDKFGKQSQQAISRKSTVSYVTNHP